MTVFKYINIHSRFWNFNHIVGEGFPPTNKCDIPCINLLADQSPMLRDFAYLTFLWPHHLNLNSKRFLFYHFCEIMFKSFTCYIQMLNSVNTDEDYAVCSTI